MTTPTELLHKLQIKAGTKLWLINVPQEIAEEITAGAEVEPVSGDSYYDGVIAFVSGQAELEKVVPRILAELPPDGLLWLAFRAADADVMGWQPLEETGLRAGDAVTIDDEWAALRFRPKEKAKA